MSYDISEARAANLKQLIVNRYGGSHLSVAKATGISLSQISQWLSGVRNMGERSARRIENCLGLTRGILDIEPNHLTWSPGDSGSDNDAPQVTITTPGDSLLVEVTNLRGIVAGDQAPAGHDQVIESMLLSRSWVSKALPDLSSVANLEVLPAPGDSMAPTLYDGDLLLIDRGVSAFGGDAIYALSFEREIFVRRVQRRIPDGALVVKPDNPHYDAFEINQENRSRINVLGRVIWLWSGRRL